MLQNFQRRKIYFANTEQGNILFKKPTSDLQDFTKPQKRVLKNLQGVRNNTLETINL